MSLKSQESLSIKKDVVYCCGEDSAGHPKVYLKFDPHTQQVTCPYCSRVFKNKTSRP